MPLYAFRCRKCGKDFEVALSLADREAGTTSCPECGAQDLELVFSSFFAKTSRKS